MTKHLLFTAFFLTVSIFAISQPANWFGDLITVNNTLFKDTALHNRGLTSATKPLLAGITKTNAKFLFNTLPNNFNPKWTGSGTDKVRPVNALLSGAAFYGADEFWQEDFETNITNGKYYTFIVGNNATANNTMSILETNYNPSQILSAQQTPAPLHVYETDPVVITATLNKTLENNEYLYVRYTTDSWNNSQFIPLSFNSNLNYSCTIPPMNMATHVKYYILSTINNTPIHADIDFFTLSLNNNNGLNYEYLVQGQIQSNSGISEAKIILNEGTNYYNDLTVNHLGTFGNTALLNLKGGQIQTWKSGTHDITTARMFYRIYLMGSSPLPTFNNVVLPWHSDLITPGEQLWENDTLTELILNNLADGFYIFEIYFEADYTTNGTNNMTHIYNNNGGNYLLTFGIDNSISYGSHIFEQQHVIIDTNTTVSIEINNWHQTLLGIFNSSNDPFILRGGSVETLKTGIHDITEVKMYYRYYLNVLQPPTFNSIILPWKQDLTYPGHQKWENDTLLINVLTGINGMGTYNFDIYYEMTYKIGNLPQAFTYTDDNSGNYYQSTYIYSGPLNTHNAVTEKNIDLFPNPSSSFININAQNLNIDIIEIYNVCGKLLKTIPYKQNTPIDISPLTNGIYFIIINTDNNNIVKRITKL